MTACALSRSILDYPSLWWGVRRDLDDVLETLPGDLTTLFWMVNDPRLVFEFDVVRKIFVREIIPAQVVHGNSHTIFNPAKLRMLGHP